MDLINIAISYLLGAVNFAFWIGKAVGINISEVYDGNLGAYNLYRATNSLFLSLVAVVLDILKVLAASYLFGIYGGIAAFLGHCYSIISMIFTKKWEPTAVGYSGLLGIGIYIPKFLLALVFSYITVFLITRVILKKEFRPFLDFMYKWAAIAFAVFILEYFNGFAIEFTLLALLAFPAYLYRQKVVFERYYCKSKKQLLRDRKWKL